MRKVAESVRTHWQPIDLRMPRSEEARLNSDLRALLVGILGGVITYYATRGINRYVARRIVRSRRRQIKQLTQELQLLEKLGVSDRALLLFGFRFLFPLIGLAAVGVAGSVILPFLTGPPEDPAPMALLMTSTVIAIAAFSASSLFRKLEDPGPTLAELREKLRDLQGMDDQPPTG